jgi:hypothetical protein
VESRIFRVVDHVNGWWQGSFFRLKNTAGLTLVGVFVEGNTLTCLETYSDAKKRTLVGGCRFLKD